MQRKRHRRKKGIPMTTVDYSIDEFVEMLSAGGYSNELRGCVCKMRDGLISCRCPGKDAEKETVNRQQAD